MTTKEMQSLKCWQKADEPMSEDEIYSYDAFRKRIRDDIREAPGARRSCRTLCLPYVMVNMSKIVQPLLDAGKLALTIPDKPKSSKQRYVRVFR